MNILAIESSCDETAAAVVTDGRTVRSNVVSSQIDVHRVTGGVVPEVAARLQLETIIPVVEKALADAKVGWDGTGRDGIYAIAVTQGPGLVGSLIVGLETAKALALAKDKPLVPVNHLAGHLYACLAAEKEFRFPYLGMVVSGGHTEFVLMRGHHDFELVGSTRDDAAGEAFDKVGKLLGLPYPAGPEISKLSKGGDPAAYHFPRAMLDQDNFDLSFSGLKTAVRQTLAGRKDNGGRDLAKQLPKKELADICASFETAVVDALVTKAVRAVRATGPSAVLLGGGVAANDRLRKSLTEKLEVPVLLTPTEYATDNAAMIGIAAYWKRDEALSGGERFAVSADPSLALGRSAKL
ncbi:MAG: tRNA (adenosine(37)-N6)-threonylcarbamoyltransferase complex transferase subunit TsaD [bacterium]|nr:tRNA (adenosine(37)-N6)-threonylcarbamoyltransferase complex transferase subunit TsaD [bacterium]MDZ4248456.1 tRNA (adenosine(37)-N6)-threonylcarbamoyltransferase complex transferase subunit TsaD [Patescibacteria group bacterium]